MKSRLRRGWRHVLLGFLVSLAALRALAQTTGSISGTVTDASGAVLAGATVEATSSSLQGIRTAKSGPDGLFRIPLVPPGEYQIRASLTTFRAVAKAASVRLGSNATVDFALEPATTEQVVVSGDAPLIDKTSTTTGTSYTIGVINQLPVARNYADIVKSNPGVSIDRGITEGRSLALAIYGATSAESQWIIDGVNTTNVSIGIQGKALNNDFVQEVEVKTGGYQAEYGRALGGVINVVTKSGGNTLHGEGFVYYDSSGTTAAQYFTLEDSPIAEMRLDGAHHVDYGFDLGGFILRDRLWFFGAYDRVTLDGHLSRIQSSTYVPAAAKFPFDSTDNLYSGKLTWNATSSTTLIGTVFADPSTTSGAAGADPRQYPGGGSVQVPVSLDPSTWYSTRSQGGTDYGLRLTQLLGPGAVVTVQGSSHHDTNEMSAADGIQYTDLTCSGGTPDNPCNLPPEPNSVTGGYGFLPDHSASSRYQYEGNVTFYVANHEIKAGGDYVDGRTKESLHATGGQLVFIRNEYGQQYYLHQFFAVSPDDPAVVPTLLRLAQVLDDGLFVQDSWRVTPRLTINLGLRWDGEQTRNYAGQTVLQFNNEWQPRIGIAWDPCGDGATKVYAFVGRFSYALPTQAAIDAFSNAAIVQTFNFDPISVVQDPRAPYPMAVLPTGVHDSVDSGVRAPSQDELTAGVERQLLPSLTVGLKGTYRSLNRVIEDRCDFQYDPSTDFIKCALINPGSSGTFASGDAPTCDGLDPPEWHQCYPRRPASPAARRIYRGIELMARQTLGNTLWLQASYVYSSLRGNYDGGVNQTGVGQTTPGVNPDFDFPALWHNAYGVLALDRPNHFRLDGYWVTPWRLTVGLQGFVESGAPLNQLGYFNSFYGSLIYLVPRGSVGRLPTLWGTNLTLSYPIAIGPMTVTLQAYLFNVFNRQIATSRDDVWSNTQQTGSPAIVFDPNQPQTNTDYGKVTGRADPRVFRAAVKVSF